MPHQFNPTVLREYDIRGIVGKTLSRADAVAVGQGFGTAVRRSGGSKVALGWDGRLTSPELAGGVAEGLASTGCDVTRVGVGPTPMLYFAARTIGVDAGLMITGSHNPPDYNGFKMMLGKASFWGPDIVKLGKWVQTGDLEKGQGKIADRDVFAAYIDRLVQGFRDGGRSLRVAWDAGNGAAGAAMAALVKRLPGTHFIINEVIDGTFPNHHPDPTVPKNLVQLQALVKREGCDLGIAFDGDGDRIGAIDEHGEIFWADQLMWLYAQDVLAENPGATIIADVKTSQVFFDEVARMGGKPVMWKTGHSVIKAKAAEMNAPLSGEMSGHIFFADRWYGFDCALYCAVRLIEALTKRKESLGQLRRHLPKVVNTPELRFPCSEDRKFKVVQEVRARLAAAKADVNDIDGVRVKTADGWWLLRASNTQDVLVARCESTSQAGLDRLFAALNAEIAKSGLAPLDSYDNPAGH